MEFEKLTKTVRVTDPENWYNQNTVEASLFVTPPYCGIVTVRILIDTIDDFMVVYDHECYVQYGELIKWAYNHLKQWMYDKMPEEISLGWLYEHGYLPD
jgi:hypothetical protein